MVRAQSTATRNASPPILALAHDALYVGIDIGKRRHVAGFVSSTLLSRHQRFEGCPALPFDNSREGFRLLIDRIRASVPLEQCSVLMEKTGHYHKPLEGYLLDMDVTVYVMHVQSRPRGLVKTDKRDALGLANHLYNQLEKGIQVGDSAQFVRRALPPTEAAPALKMMMGHRFELVNEATKRRNQLTAICDQLFPEFTMIFVDPNKPIALAVRAAFPTAHAVATASAEALCHTKGGRGPNRAAMAHLQELAARSIGITEGARVRSLAFEQGQLIRELAVIREHIAQIDVEIGQIVAHAREGRILMALPGIGVTSAAAILAAIGHIDNFPDSAHLKAYFGWAPKVTQSGMTKDSASLTRAGERTMKQVMYMVALRCIKDDTEFAPIYKRLVERKCAYDERTRAYKGKRVVIARIAGQLTRMVYAFLKADADLLARTPTGQPPPEPMLYDRALHKSHIAGSYRSMKPRPTHEDLIQLPKRHPSA